MAKNSIPEYMRAPHLSIRRSMRLRKRKDDDGDADNSRLSHVLSDWILAWQRPKQRLYIKILLGLVIVLLVISGRLLGASNQQHNSIKPRYLSLLIATPEPKNVELCKTILSAQVLNYPVPNLIQWGNSSDGKPVRTRDRAANRLYHMHKYLQGLPESAEDGIVILLERPNIWFQLRPDVLLRRYFGMTKAANARLRKRYSWDVTQKVMFASTECSSNVTALACHSIPECRRRKGPMQNCLSQGAIIGSARDVRAVLDRAQNKMQRNATGEIFQILHDIYEQQEYQREVLRQVLYTSWIARWLNKWRHQRQVSTDLIPAPASGRMPMADIQDIKFDFGIGLDFTNELSSPMVEDDVQWTTHSVLARDIEASAPPFWTVSGADATLPHEAGWRDVELLSVRETATIPAMLSRPLQAHSYEDTAASEDLWARLWLSKHARALYSAAERLPATALASIVDSTGGEQLFWNRQITHNKAGAWTATGKWLHWQDMCGADEQWKEVFRDSAGGWKRTEWY